MFHQRGGGRHAAVDQVDHAFGQVQFIQHLEEALGAEGRLRRWFQDKGIAAGDGGGQEPERHHEGEVKRRNGGEDAGRLAHGGFVNAGADVFQAVAAHENGHAHGEVDAFDAAPHFAARFVHGLAVLAHDDLRDFFEIVLDQDFEVVHILGAHQNGRAAPLVEGGFGGADGRVDIGRRRVGTMRQQLAGRRVMHGREVRGA